MMYWGWNAGPGGWVGALFGLVIWFVVIGLFALLVVRLVSGPRGPEHYAAPARPDDPEEILRARFAHGEIAPDDYEQRLDLLRRTRPPQPPAQK